MSCEKYMVQCKEFCEKNGSSNDMYCLIGCAKAYEFCKKNELLRKFNVVSKFKSSTTQEKVLSPPNSQK